MTTIAAALERKEAARADLNKTLAEVADDFRTHLAAALDAMAEQTVIEQPAIITEMGAADRVALRLNLGQARESAMQGVDVQLAKLNLDDLARRAQANHVGVHFVDANAILSPLLRVTGELLTKAGYSTVSVGRLNTSYDIGGIRGIGSLAGTAARRLDAAIEKFAQAQIALQDAETAHAQAVARELWNKADEQ